jgi:hypothetical protein
MRIINFYERWFKGVNDGLLKLIRPDVSVPGLIQKHVQTDLVLRLLILSCINYGRRAFCLSGLKKQTKCLLLLWHDYLELSHHIADDERTPDFIYFHAIIIEERKMFLIPVSGFVS